MPTTLTYGKSTTCLLDSTEALQLRAQGTECIPTDQIAELVRSQLAEPANYPPLSQATIPGDRVVVAIEPGIPQQLTVVEGVLRALRDAGVEEELTTLLLADAQDKADVLQAELAKLGYANYQIQIHDPDDEKEIAYLGASQAGLAIRLNRALCDADLVLPINRTSDSPTTDRTANTKPALSGLFPIFSDRETLERCSTANAEHFPAINPEHQQEMEECSRWLGVGISLQLVPGAGDQLATILAGECSTVAKHAQEEYRSQWCVETEAAGNLVIATITGDAEQQTWQNVGRSLAAAQAVLEPGGSIAICTELAETPGLALGQLTSDADHMIVEREILRTPSADSGPAIQACRAIERGPVFLRSLLRSEVVESLGFTPLESDNELERLAETRRPCIVLEEAHRLLPVLAETQE